MARSRSLTAFSRRMKFRAKQVTQGTETAVRRAALAADQTAVLATPVDTGRARANWVVAVGTPSDNAGAQPDPSGAGALGQGAGAIARWKLGAGSIFISNSVPYIIPLDKGSSAQAPGGMSAQAVMAARAQLAAARLLRD